MVVIIAHRYDKKLKSKKQDGLGGLDRYISNPFIPSMNHVIVYIDKESYFNFNWNTQKTIRYKQTNSLGGFYQWRSK